MDSFPSALRDMWLIGRREFGLTFRGRRGIVLCLALLVLAALPAVARSIGSNSPDAAELQQGQNALLVKLFRRDVVRSLIDCPAPLTVGMLATFFFQPILVLLIGVESIAGEVDSGAMRFWTVRASRVGIVLGKALGLWFTVCALTLLAHAVMWVAASIGSGRDPAGVLRWGPKLYLLTCVTALMQVSIVIWLGTLTRNPRRVLAIGMALLGVLRVGRTLLDRRGLALGSWLPGGIDNRLLSPQAMVCMGGLALAAGWSIACLAGASAIFARRDA